MGCVAPRGDDHPAALGQRALLALGLLKAVRPVVIDWQGGSSQQTVQFAARSIMFDTPDVVMAAHVESMIRDLRDFNVHPGSKANIDTPPCDQPVLGRL
jgi:acetyl-CoA acetyltransferase